MDKTLTTKEVAVRLGVSPPRVRQMILIGNLPAVKFGRDLVVKESDLALVADRKPGRPPKPKPADEPATKVKAKAKTATGAAEKIAKVVTTAEKRATKAKGRK